MRTYIYSFLHECTHIHSLFLRCAQIFILTQYLRMLLAPYRIKFMKNVDFEITIEYVKFVLESLQIQSKLNCSKRKRQTNKKRKSYSMHQQRQIKSMSSPTVRLLRSQTMARLAFWFVHLLISEPSLIIIITIPGLLETGRRVRQSR